MMGIKKESKKEKKRCWVFFYDGKKKKRVFEIFAKDSFEAYRKAYDLYGSCVENMFYTEKLFF